MTSSITQRLSENIKDSLSQIDWFKIAGLRNVLVHDYLGVDVTLVWNIICNELPNFKIAAAAMMR